MPAKKIQLKDNQGVGVFPKTVGEEVYQLDNSGNITNTLWAEKGAEVNTIETISVNNTAVSPDANRNVNITVPSNDTYTISAVSSPDAAYSAQYKLMKSAGGTGTHTQVGDTINIPKDMVISSGSVVDVIFDTTDDHLYDTSTNPYTDVTTLIVGSGTATAADAGKYIKLVVANATNDKIYISVSDLVDTYTAGNGITISSNAIAIDTTVVATQTDLADKADKVTGATSGNFAGLDSNGNLTDSGSKASDFLTSHQDISGKADKTDTVLLTSLSRGRKSGTTVGTNSFAFGNDVTASGNYSFAEGYKTVASAAYSHAEGYETTASAAYSHAEGFQSTASGQHSHVEGYNNTVSNSNSHCEGANCVASGYEAHVEGYVNYGTGDEVHVEGTCTMASGDNSHIEGVNNYTDSYCTHVEGCGHDVHSSQVLTHVSGVYSDTGQTSGPNITFQYLMPPDKTLAGSASTITLGKYAEVVGNGTDYNSRSNARTLDWLGNEELAGDLTIYKGTTDEVSVSSLATSVAGKQDALTAGANIVINNNTISAAQIFGTSSSTAADTTKTVSIPAITSLETGQVIIVQPSVTSEAGASSLQLNNFTAYPMRYNGVALTTTTDGTVWSANFPSFWVFDGSYWVFAGHGLDSNTTYTINYSLDAGKYTAGSGTYAVTRYSIIAQKLDGTWEKITKTSATYSTATSKSVNTTGFILNQLRYYSTTSAVSSGNQIASSTCNEKASSVDLRYSTNCGGTTTWLAGEYIYLVGTMGNDGLFYLDTTQWWSNALPSTNDGKLYIRLGIVLEDAGYKISFFSDRPIFYHDGSKVCEYAVHRDDLASVAFTGDYNDLTNLPTIPTVPTLTSELTNDGDGNGNYYVLDTSLATVATSGDYNDLQNLPTIPTNTSELNNDGDGNGTTYVLDTSLATVATSGDYNDLQNLPTIPSNTSELNNDGDGNGTTYVLDTSLATVATSGDYGDLLNTPSILDYDEVGSYTNKYAKLKDGNTYLVPVSAWPAETGSGGGSITLQPYRAYYRSGVNANMTLNLGTAIYTDYAVGYNIVFEYVSGTITWPQNVHWNVDITNFTPTANTWYEMDIKSIVISGTYHDFGVIQEYAN